MPELSCSTQSRRATRVPSHRASNSYHVSAKHPAHRVASRLCPRALLNCAKSSCQGTGDTKHGMVLWTQVPRQGARSADPSIRWPRLSLTLGDLVTLPELKWVARASGFQASSRSVRPWQRPLDGTDPQDQWPRGWPRTGRVGHQNGRHPTGVGAFWELEAGASRAALGFGRC